VNVDDALERIGYGDWIEVNGAEGIVRLTDI
jgi:hypothetical protein